MRSWSLLSAVFVLVVTACSGDPGPSGPAGPVGTAISGALDRAGVAAVSAQGVELEHRLLEPVEASTGREVSAASCAEIGAALQGACEQVTGSPATRYTYCFAQAAYFYANAVPRCAARVTAGDDGDPIPDTWAFDFSGEPYDGPAPECGNGRLEPGEQCDDGNNEMWDGCDPNCQLEEFNGCEAVIEYHYELQQLAVVDKELWDGPRSHMMVNTHAVALRDVTRQTCDAALATGTDVCNELTQTMPFVAWCGPQVELFDDDGGPACAVQLQVGFRRLDPDAGVYTLELPGVLAFTIR